MDTRTIRHPVSEKEMMRDSYSGPQTICQTLRDIWSMTDNAEIKLKCRLAFSMAKAMDARLKAYKNETRSR